MLKTFRAAVFAAGMMLVDGAAAKKLGLGQPITAEQLRGWDIDVRGDGAGLPAGSGSALQGQSLFSERCARCHGANGQGGNGGPELKGGQGSLATSAPVKTVGSFWPHAPTIFDYIRRSMPMGQAQSLSADEAYALTAYLLFINSIITDLNFEVTQATLPAIQMPNRNGFIMDNREKAEAVFWNAQPCMARCALVAPPGGDAAAAHTR
jgi:S-disulfanyl-L-cysteine oxidoreductase SoxD